MSRLTPESLAVIAGDLVLPHGQVWGRGDERAPCEELAEQGLLRAVICYEMHTEHPEAKCRLNAFRGDLTGEQVKDRFSEQAWEQDWLQVKDVPAERFVEECCNTWIDHYEPTNLLKALIQALRASIEPVKTERVSFVIHAPSMADFAAAARAAADALEGPK